MYAEIRNDYVWGPAAEGGAVCPESGDILAAVTLDGWLTAQDDESGTVIANVILTKHGDVVVDFHDNGARLDTQVLACINEAKARLRDIWHKEKARHARQPKNQAHRLEYQMVLNIPAVVLEQINKYLSATTEDEYQGEDNTITYTAKFPDGKEMDVKCCGCRDEASWTEAVLFDEHGYQIACSDVGEDFTGRWELEADGALYVSEVRVSGSTTTCMETGN